MLRLKNITKTYAVADIEVKALKNVNLSFRKSEFVSILGPSGCGKTTMLNIIGGLDRYSEGDLIIEGKSTKEFKNKDWDYYRNHSIGFVFQSYNLIPHQTILGNVELALQIAGLTKAERTEKAKNALDKVGLNGLYNKKPNQLSGGQCQRVAIARALVNDPEILLADEPTGALDTVTSVQIMELIKKIADEKLVIMVTHNPELAERYSTRIIRLLDGEVISDTSVFDEQDEIAEIEELRVKREWEKAELAEDIAKNKTKKHRKNRVKMSFWTAFKLSAKNLFTKKARTIMTSIAGSIGIVGISLVLSVSVGVQSYIGNMQNDMLSGNPVRVSKSTFDFAQMMQASTDKDKVDAMVEAGFVNVDKMIEYLIERANSTENLFVQNNITKEYIDYVSSMPKEYYASLFYDFGLDVMNNIYTDYSLDQNSTKEYLSLTAIKAIYSSLLEQTEYGKYSSYLTEVGDSFRQAPDDEDYVLSQYDMKYGKIATAENEIMIVLEENSLLTDILLAQLGYYTQEQYLNMIYKATDDPKYNPELDKDKFSYDELVGKSFTYYPNDELYTATGSKESPFKYSAYDTGSFNNGEELTVVGILEPKKTISYGCMKSGFYYTQALTEKIIRNNYNSEIANYLRDNELDAFKSVDSGFIKTGITYDYSYTFEGKTYNEVGLVGKQNSMGGMFPPMGGGDKAQLEIFVLSINNLGGDKIPYEIVLYNDSFSQKDKALAYLDKWNSDETITVNGVEIPPDQREEIKYTDTLSLVVAMINTFIKIVTYALVGFTALSLVVSSVMIGIITYISVVERIKEIGVIRALGGRKRDVSNLFISETFIIGFSSGLLGIVITYILSFIANVIFNHFLNIAAIAIFPWYYAVIMLSVSVILTLISGLMPAKSAAKKDPVVALRTE